MSTADTTPTAATTKTANNAPDTLDLALHRCLRQAREAKGVTIQDAALATKIPQRFLHIFESENYSALPNDIYAKIYVKGYAAFLGLPLDEVLDSYAAKRANDGERSERAVPQHHPAQSVPATALVSVPELLRAAITIVLAVAIACYIGLQVKKIFAPPQISLLSPADGMITTNREIAIEGQTEPEVSLHINGKTITPDSAGRFADTINLQEGLNVIRVTGAKKYSRDMVVTRDIIVKPASQAAAIGPAEFQGL